MKKLLSLAEVKAIYGDAVFETETAFGVNIFGKYKPNITFIVPKEFGLSRNGSPIDPMDYISDREVTDNMNINWNGSAEFTFGDYWTSRKGGACFRPQNPISAQHLLVRVNWGGAFNESMGSSKEYANGIGALYFRSASSNAGRSGYDYWVLPVGFTYVRRDEEIDGGAPLSDRSGLFAERAKVYCQKHANLQKKAADEADTYLKEKAEAEKLSCAARSTYEEQLNDLNERLEKLRNIVSCDVNRIELNKFNFAFGGSSFLYTTENVKKVQEMVNQKVSNISASEAKKKADAEAKAEFEPKFSELAQRFVRIGWRMEITSSTEAKVFEPYERSYGWNTYHEEHEHSFPFSKEGFYGCKAILESKETEICEKRGAEEAAEELNRANEAAKSFGLPSDVRIWYRSGATNAGSGWVIMQNGMERDYDEIKNPRPRYRDEGYGIWHQILPGEVVLSWKHACTAAEHEFEVIYCPDKLTDAQKERIAEIQNGLEDEFLGKVGLTGKYTCPSIGKGWNLI